MTRFHLTRASGPERECEHVRSLMSDYLDADLRAAEREQVERHVAICPRCQTVLANLRRTLTALGGLRTAPAEDDAALTETAKRLWRERVR